MRPNQTPTLGESCLHPSPEFLFAFCWPDRNYEWISTSKRFPSHGAAMLAAMDWLNACREIGHDVGVMVQEVQD